MEAARNLTGKEQERMNRLRKWIKNMKYRHKLTILLVVTALVPMTVLALYAHSRQSTMVRSSDLEDMQSIIDQTKESIDSQTAVYSSLLNYLTYSPDIEEIIKEKNIDNYTAYEKYNEIADPLLSVPKSYHDAINRIQLFARSIQVEHEYTLVPLAKMKEEWWSSELQDDVRIQWLVNLESKEVAAPTLMTRNIKRYNSHSSESLQSLMYRCMILVQFKTTSFHHSSISSFLCFNPQSTYHRLNKIKKAGRALSHKPASDLYSHACQSLYSNHTFTTLIDRFTSLRF